MGLACPDLPVTDFAIDSRAVSKDGTLFFALKGEQCDGHSFLRAAKKGGAVAAVVDRSFRGETAGLELLPVDDVTQSLQQLATAIQKERKQRIIAVTGSVGKTTTKEFLATLLAEKYSVDKTPGNSNSQVGLPLAILKSAGLGEVFVVEMGMSHLHEIKKLTYIAPPEGVVITKVGYSHTDTVPGGLNGIAQAKAEILSHPQTEWAVIEYDAFQYPIIQNTGCQLKVTYGTSLADLFLDQEGGLVDRGDIGPLFHFPFTETHFRQNCLGAIAASRIMGLSWDEIAKGLPKLKSIPLRFEKITLHGATFINDCYNASPESMESALHNLPNPSLGGKTIAVFGEMSALGTYSEEGHTKIATLALDKVDHLLCYGKQCLPMVSLFTQAGKPAHLYHTLAELKLSLLDLTKPGDIILIKGSRSNHLHQVLEGEG